MLSLNGQRSVLLFLMVAQAQFFLLYFTFITFNPQLCMMKRSIRDEEVQFLLFSFKEKTESQNKLFLNYSRYKLFKIYLIY